MPDEVSTCRSFEDHLLLYNRVTTGSAAVLLAMLSLIGEGAMQIGQMTVASGAS